jgi:hypothetical protein
MVDVPDNCIELVSAKNIVLESIRASETLDNDGQRFGAKIEDRRDAVWVQFARTGQVAGSFLNSLVGTILAHFLEGLILPPPLAHNLAQTSRRHQRLSPGDKVVCSHDSVEQRLERVKL